MPNVEERIKGYFEKKQKIGILKKSKISLEEKIKELKKKMENISLPTDISSPSFDVNISTSDKSSYFEKSLIKQTEKLDNMIENLANEIEQINENILEIEVEQIFFESVFNTFSDDNKLLLVLKYDKKYSVIKICRELNISTSLYNKRKRLLIKDIENLKIIGGK